jgi:hypothetical protein
VLSKIENHGGYTTAKRTPEYRGRASCAIGRNVSETCTEASVAHLRGDRSDQSQTRWTR